MSVSIETRSRSSQRAEETRNLIFQAAEQRFAAKGFFPTRLEDIADDVGITRTAVIYHYKDKETLYNAVLEYLFTELDSRIKQALESDLPILQRIENAVLAWVDYAGNRPTLMRLFMREVAGSEEGLREEVSRYVNPMFERLVVTLQQGQDEGVFRAVSPIQFWSILAGATMFFIMDAPLLAASASDEVARIDTYGQELIRVIHALLGIEPGQQGGEST